MTLRSPWRGVSMRRFGNCAPRPASPACGVNKASAWRRATRWHRSSVASARGSTRRFCKRPGPCSMSWHRPDRAASLPIGILEIAGLELGRPYDHFFARLLELRQIVADDAARLSVDDARLCPFTVRPEPHIAHDGAERRLVHVFGNRLLVEVLGRLDGLSQDLHRGIGVGWQVEAEQVGTRGAGMRLVSLDELVDAPEHHRRLRRPEVVVDDAVELGTELLLQGGVL